MILSCLAEGLSEIKGYLPAQDCLRTIQAFQEMGISIRPDHREGSPSLFVDGKGLRGLTEPGDVLDCGNSGTTMRLLAGLLSGQSFFSVLSGDPSLRNRPMRRIVDPLKMMGADIRGRANDAHAPLGVSGKPLSPIEYALPIPSAQVKSAILLAGLTGSGPTTILEPCPSRDHTERMFQHFGIPLTRKRGSLSLAGDQRFSGRKIEVPGDLSSAAFFLVAGTLVEGSEMTLCNVGVNPTRTGILDILNQMGADIRLDRKRTSAFEPLADLHVRSRPLKGVKIEGELILRAIDEFPILCVAAAKAEGETVIRGAADLRHKESDRIETMATALRGMGVEVETFPDGIRIVGKERWQGSHCRTAGDHRVAMAMAVAGLIATGGNIIDDTDCISISFPGFFDLLSILGS